MTKTLTTWNPVSVVLLALVALLLARYLTGQGVEAVKAAGNAVDPLNHDNVFNRYFVRAYRALSGSEGTPGGDLADWVHSDNGGFWWN